MKKFSSTTRMSSRRNSPRKRRLQFGIGLVVGALILLTFFRGPFGALASFVIAPVGKIDVWFAESTGVIPTFFRDRNELYETQQTLQDQLDTYAAERSAHDALREENESLRSLLSSNESERIAAGVLMRPNMLPYDALLIDRGSNDGVVVDAPVYAHTQTVIGSVTRTYPNSALVTLVSAPEFVSTVYVYGPDIFTEAVGQGGGVIKVGVPQGISLTVGDSVVLPSVYPGFFGTIAFIEALESSPEQYGYVVSDQALAHIRHVSVGQTPLSRVSFEDALDVVELMRDDLFQVEVPEEILISTSTPTTTDEILEAVSEEVAEE